MSIAPLDGNGQICGVGTNPAGETRAFVLGYGGNIPEPSSVAPFLVGMVPLGLALHRRRTRPTP